MRRLPDRSEFATNSPLEGTEHRSHVRKSGRFQVPAIRLGSVEHRLWEEVLSFPWRAETSNSRSRPRETSDFRPMISARTARIDDNLGRGTDGSNPLPSSGESANFRSLSGGRIGVRNIASRSAWSVPKPTWIRRCAGRLVLLRLGTLETSAITAPGTASRVPVSAETAAASGALAC